MPHVTDEEFNLAAATLIKRKEILKSSLEKASQGEAWASMHVPDKPQGAEFEVINSYLKQRAQVATNMGDLKIYNACNQLIGTVSKVSSDVATGQDWYGAVHGMNMLELDLRYFCAVTNEGRTRM